MTEHAHTPEPDIQPPNQAKSILAFLAEQKGGALVAEMSDEMRNLVEGMENHFDKFRGTVSGSLTLNIKFTIDPKLGAYRVETEYAVRHPKMPAASTIMWLGRDGNLGTTNPQQLNLPFNQIASAT
ncbi:MAG TPA: hypothetical protein VGN16_09605 [Acidobacteriaceae bacterium]|jgi:hypothetical protein